MVFKSFNEHGTTTYVGFDRKRNSKLLDLNAVTKDSMQDFATGAWSNFTVFNPPLTPALPLNGWTKQSLAPYKRHKYAHLYGERKYARVFPQSFNFLALPAELRNHIYDIIFNFGSIELAPLHHRDGRNRIKHMRRYKKEIVPRLRFLRANKQVNTEAAPIFYGKHTYICNIERFSRHPLTHRSQASTNSASQTSTASTSSRTSCTPSAKSTPAIYARSPSASPRNLGPAT